MRGDRSTAPDHAHTYKGRHCQHGTLTTDLEHPTELARRWVEHHRPCTLPPVADEPSAQHSNNRPSLRAVTGPMPRLMALGSAAVLSVYAAGFHRTRGAAAALEAHGTERRRPIGEVSAISTVRDVQVPETPRDEAASAARAGVAGSASSHTQQTSGDTGLTPDTASPTVPQNTASSLAPPKQSADTMARETTPLPSATGDMNAEAPVAGKPLTTAPAVTVATNTRQETAAGPVVVAKPNSVAPVPVTAGVTTGTSPANGASTNSAAKGTKATAPVDSSTSVKAPAGWQDGTYVGYGTSRHGDVESTVVIEHGKIVAAAISRCLTQYSCSWIAHLQQQVVARQNPDVDNVSGATHSANAFYYSVVDALAKAK